MDDPPDASTEPPHVVATGARRTRRLTWAIALAWVVVHLVGLAASGWRLEGGALTWGSPDLAVLRQHGALVPALVSQGEVQRVVTGAGTVVGGVLSLLLALWVFTSAAGSLERGAGTARAGLVLFAATLAGGTVAVAMLPTSNMPLPAAWHLVLGAVGAQVPWGLAVGGPEGRTLVSSALAFVVLSALLMLFQPGGGWWLLWGEAGAFAGGALALTVLGPRRLAAPPSPLVRIHALAALLAVLVAIGLQVRQASADPGARLLEEVLRVESEAVSLWDARDPSRVPRADRTALGVHLDALTASKEVEALEGAAELRAYLAAMRPLATGDLRDPTAVGPRLRAAQRSWHAMELRWRVRLGVAPREPAYWR